MPTFRNTLSVPSSKASRCLHLLAFEDGTESVPKRRHIKFRRRGNTQKKTYNIQNSAKVLNQESKYLLVPFPSVFPLTCFLCLVFSSAFFLIVFPISCARSKLPRYYLQFGHDNLFKIFLGMYHLRPTFQLGPL